MSANITIHTVDNKLIWNKASEFMINWLKLYHNITRKTLFFLSGGSAVKIYECIKYYVSSIKYRNIAFAQIDERFFGKEQRTDNKEQINAEVIRKTGLWEVCDSKNIPYYLVSQEGTLIGSAQKYNQQIAHLFENFSYKIGVFGIGEDGHTAGLLPGYVTMWNIDKYVSGYENSGQFKQRISLTPKAINLIDYGIVVAIGEKKRWMIEKALDPINQNNLDKYPAAIIQKIKKVDLFTDII